MLQGAILVLANARLALGEGLPDQVLEIRMQRLPGFGDGRPAYHLTLKASGAVIFDGLGCCRHYGHWEARIGTEGFYALCNKIKTLQFDKLRTDRLQAFDVPRSTVAVKLATGTISVAENGDDGTKELHQIERALEEAVRGATKWRRTQTPKYPQLIRGDTDTWLSQS